MGCHRGTAIAVKDQLFGLDVLFFNGCFNELLSQVGVFAMRQHPADRAAAIDIQDDVKVIIGPFFRTLQFRDVPRPNFIGAGRKKFRLFVIGMLQLVSPFASALVLFKNAIHRPHAAQVITFIK